MVKKATASKDAAAPVANATKEKSAAGSSDGTPATCPFSGASASSGGTCPFATFSQKNKPPASPSSSKKKKSSLSALSVIIALLAVAVASFAVLEPKKFEHTVAIAKTRALQLVEQFQQELTLGETPVAVNCQDAEAFLTDFHAVKGFHVLCVKKTPMETLQITAYKDGNAPSRNVESAMDLGSFRQHLESSLEIPPPKDKTAEEYKQPYAFFTTDGKRLEHLSEMVNSIVFLFEGGQFIWPGIKIGHKTVVKDVFGRGDVVMETASMIPLVFTIEEFLKDEEIDVIMDLSLKHLRPSGVTLIDGHENRPATDWRTSTTYFLSSSKHQRVRDIDQRTEDLTKVPKSHQEDVQVLRYEKTQKYDQHTDYFPAHLHKNSPNVLRSIDYGYKNRMITVLWYMSDVAEGGETIFPRSGGAPLPTSMKDCTKGLKVPPRKRSVVMFYSMLPNGEGDPYSLHGGCPVIEGTKYAANKWVWNKPRD